MGARYWTPLFALAIAAAALVVSVAAQGQDQGQVREFTIVGDHYSYSPATITVGRNDLVKVTFTAKDIPHSFTLEEYRISKRAAAGRTVTFEFRADHAAGSYPFYCNLTQDAKCRDMKGTLIVR
jgi:heme/copper-type cytochrome/quinol oxidase subunit 2